MRVVLALNVRVDRAEIHRPLHDGGVVWDLQLGRVQKGGDEAKESLASV